MLAVILRRDKGSARHERAQRWRFDLAETDLSGANLSREVSYEGNTREEVMAIIPSIYGADLRGVELTASNLSRANLTATNLSGASLSRANLNGASLGYADLSNASLNNANLSGANLCYAILIGTHFNGADLRGADLRETKFARARAWRDLTADWIDDDVWVLTSAGHPLANTHADAKTRLPIGMPRPAHWPPEKLVTEEKGDTNATPPNHELGGLDQ